MEYWDPGSFFSSFFFQATMGQAALLHYPFWPRCSASPQAPKQWSQMVMNWSLKTMSQNKPFLLISFPGICHRDRKLTDTFHTCPAFKPLNFYCFLSLFFFLTYCGCGFFSLTSYSLHGLVYQCFIPFSGWIFHGLYLPQSVHSSACGYLG
jgi:hypothetical protein